MEYSSGVVRGPQLNLQLGGGVAGVFVKDKLFISTQPKFQILLQIYKTEINYLFHVFPELFISKNLQPLSLEVEWWPLTPPPLM